VSRSRWKPPAAEEPCRYVLNVRMTPSMARALREWAQARNMSVEALVREVLLSEAARQVGEEGSHG